MASLVRFMFFDRLFKRYINPEPFVPRNTDPTPFILFVFAVIHSVRFSPLIFNTAAALSQVNNVWRTLAALF